MSILSEAIANFREPVHTPTKRSPDTYASIWNRCLTQLSCLIVEHDDVRNDQQLKREIRNEIDYQIRRYHNYAIKENFGAHYIEVGAEKTDFEHMIPASTVRELCIAGILSPEQALNVPTCKLSKDKHVELREKGWGNKTPDPYLFWKRYEYCFDVSGFTTWDGEAVNPLMTLDDHFARFANQFLA